MISLGRDFHDFLTLLNQHQVRYLIVGGFAMAAHGRPRYTKDIDIWLDELRAALNPGFFQVSQLLDAIIKFH